MPPPISKAAATQMATAYNIRFITRCFDQLRANGQSGVVGATIPYGTAGAGAVTVAVNGLQATGWTVQRDDPNSQLIVT